jgi:cytochrome c oxidase subunit 1
MNEPMGKIQFWLYMIGFNVTFFPMHFLGVQGMPRRQYIYAGDLGWNLWNAVSSLGAYLTAIGGIVFFINIIYSLKKGAKAPADCWDGRTLEWSIPSPVPEYNFGVEPEVKELDDFWHKKYGDDGKRKQLPPEPSFDPAKIHLPNPSFWPILLAAGITTAVAGFFIADYGLMVSLVGIFVTVLSSYGWVYEEA